MSDKENEDKQSKQEQKRNQDYDKGFASCVGFNIKRDLVNGL